MPPPPSTPAQQLPDFSLNAPNPTFSTLPSPFFAMLSATLADKGWKGTFASLTSTCKVVRAGTLAGLYRKCVFEARFNLKVVLKNKELVALIREVWIDMNLWDWQEPDVLKKLFPNATSILHNHRYPPKNEWEGDNPDLAIGVPVYEASCTFPFISEILGESMPRWHFLHFNIAPGARAAFKEALVKEAQGLNLEKVRHWDLHIDASSEEDAISILDTVSPIGPIIYRVRVNILTPRIQGWLSKEHQHEFIHGLSAYKNMAALFWTADLPTTAEDSQYMIIPHNDAPSRELFESLILEILQTNPDFSLMCYCLRWISGGKTKSHNWDGWAREAPECKLFDPIQVSYHFSCEPESEDEEE